MSQPKVALFATCLVDQLFPDIGAASVRLLRHLGVDLDFPAGQTCCGQPAYNAGHHGRAREIAEHHLEVFEPYDFVVLPSGSCAAMVALHYPELAREDPPLYERAMELAGRTFELTTFVVEVLGQPDSGSDLTGVTVTYHDSCHALRSLGVGEAPRTLLRSAGAQLTEAEGHDVCCGFGGLFSVKMADISSAMARSKLEGIRGAGSQVLTSTDAGCLMQLQGALRRETAPAPRVQHVVELLWQGIAGAAA